MFVVLVVVGMLVGLIYGKVIIWFVVFVFIIMLGGMIVWCGVMLLVNDGGLISGFGLGLCWWGMGVVFGLLVLVLVFVLVVFVGFVV